VTTDRTSLRSLEIEGYRTISHLQIPELGRVNLFVGENNVGKTALLEAVRIYVSPRPLVVLWQLVQSRGTYRPRPDSRRSGQDESEAIPELLQSVGALLSGSFTTEPHRHIRIGPAGLESDVLAISMPWASRELGSDSSGEDGSWAFLSPETEILRVDRHGRADILQLERALRTYGILRGEGEGRALWIPAEGLAPLRLLTLWDRVVASGDAAEAERILRTVVPGLLRIHSMGDSRSRDLALEIEGMSRPIPLGSMGDGTQRVLGIALALVEARQGVLLVDEIENGLHFTLQDEVWETIFSLAQKLDVQVFATTHSWDAVVGFQYAANLSEEEGMLYRLERRSDDRMVAIRYTEREVEIAAEQRIEVR
jgi:hypothetical protein